MNCIGLGPYFSRCDGTRKSPALEALGIQLEWVNSEHSVVAPLFANSRSNVAFNGVVIERRRVPFAVPCSRCQVVEAGGEVYLPIDAVLVALYRGYHANRNIFTVLEELSALIRLRHSVTRPITARGILSQTAEKAGFRLNTILRDHSAAYAELVWETATGINRFHTSIAGFQIRPDGLLDEGIWVPPGTIGVSSLLAQELHQLSPGLPRSVFSQQGQNLLRSAFRETLPNKTANENAVSIGVNGPL